MSAKEIAIKDLRSHLKEQGRSFLAFHKELDPSMQALVDDYIKQQENL